VHEYTLVDGRLGAKLGATQAAPFGRQRRSEQSKGLSATGHEPVSKPIVNMRYFIFNMQPAFLKVEFVSFNLFVLGILNIKAIF